MIMDVNLLATFALLVGLEIVLGIDNILLISILTDRLPLEHRNKARIIGLGIALGARCLLLLGASWLLALSQPAFMGFSWKDLVLLVGGAFLIYKAVKEIHHAVEGIGHEANAKTVVHMTFSSVITQIVLLDIVFSVDSVITAVGLTNNLWVIYSAVIISFIFVLAFSGKIAGFIQTHPALKVLALSFLVTIGVTLCVEGFGAHVPKSYIYLPMGFALLVEALQMRLQHNANKGMKP